MSWFHIQGHFEVFEIGVVSGLRNQIGLMSPLFVGYQRDYTVDCEVYHCGQQDKREERARKGLESRLPLVVEIDRVAKQICGSQAFTNSKLSLFRHF